MDISQIPPEIQKQIGEMLGITDPVQLQQALQQYMQDNGLDQILRMNKDGSDWIDTSAEQQLDPMSKMIARSAEPLIEPQPTGETYNVGGAQLPISPNVIDRRGEPKLPLLKEHLYDKMVRPWEEAYEDIRSGNLGNLFRERPEYGDGGINVIGGPPDFSGSSDSLWDMKQMLREGGKVPRMPDEDLQQFVDEDETMLGVP